MVAPRRSTKTASDISPKMGADATPLREIALGLEVTKAALYYHFPSKEELLRALVSPYLDDLGAVLLEYERSPGHPADPIALLRMLAVTRIRHADEFALLADPAVRRSERLATRVRELHVRSIAAVLHCAAVAATERHLAEAALGALDSLTCLPAADRPSSDDVAGIAAAVLAPAPAESDA